MGEQESTPEQQEHHYSREEVVEALRALQVAKGAMDPVYLPDSDPEVDAATKILES